MKNYVGYEGLGGDGGGALYLTSKKIDIDGQVRVDGKQPDIYGSSAGET